MTKTKKTSIVFIIAATIATFVFTYLEKKFTIFGDLDHESLYFILLGLVIITFLSYKIRKTKRLLKRADDELSILKKYKASYYAYRTTLFIWIIVFILQRHFVNAQAMLAVGMIVSVIFGIAAKFVANSEADAE